MSDTVNGEEITKVKKKPKSVFDSSNKTDHTKANMFFDPGGGVTFQRFETMKYPYFDKLTTQTLGFFWKPEEIELLKDISDFKNMPRHEQHIFVSNLQRQILLDSINSRSPAITFLPIIGIPELEEWIISWTFSEMIHSRSYTHMIRAIFSDPSVVFDGVLDLKEIVDCASDVTKHYDTLINKASLYNMFGEGTHTINGETVEVSLYDLKKALWFTIVSVNILEGLRFFASFVSNFSLAENKKLEGSAKIIKLICRDECIHLGSTQMMLKLLPKDDPDFVKIEAEVKDECVQMYKEAVEQEKDWAKYLFQHGSIIGLTEEMLCEYLEFLANKRMKAIGLPTLFKNRSTNPLPWTNKWISGQEVQVAPQEAEISSYENNVKQDITDDTFSGFEL